MDHAKARVSTDHQYEDFEPSTEWIAEEGSKTLIVYLPGFRKEQLKVQVTSTRTLRISGERPLGANKWSRFREEFSVPSDCDINAISARFESSMLYVKLPTKITPVETQEIEEVKPPTEAPKPQQEPTKEPQPKKNGQEHATDHHHQQQQVASATRKEDKQTNEKTNGGAKAGDVSQKMQEKEKEKQPTSEDKKSQDAKQKEKEKEKSDGLAEAGKPASTNTGSSGGEVQLGKYKKAATGLVMELKKPKKLMNFVLAVLLAVVLVLYVRNAIRSLGTSKNTIQ